MTANEILELQSRRPFEGLRLYVSDGAIYEVRHTERMVVTRTLVHMALSPGKDGVPERSAYCDPVHITRIEPLKNGSRKDGAKKHR